MYSISKGTKFVCSRMDVIVMQPMRSGSNILDLMDDCAINCTQSKLVSKGSRQHVVFFFFGTTRQHALCFVKITTQDLKVGLKPNFTNFERTKYIYTPSGHIYKQKTTF
jgi:hypothetical protein